MRLFSTLFLLLILTNPKIVSQELEKKTLLIRCDDIGMSHAVNEAALELLDTGLPFSSSVMFVCPWYQEAVDILKDRTNVSIGIHLTLNSEWKNFRWGPVTGKDAVPSLVDEHGYFFPSRAKLYENNPELDDIETELRAQIERALKSGIKIDYIDYHMGTAVDKPEYRNIVEKLSGEYELGISRYFGEVDIDNMYSIPIENKLDSLLQIMKTLETGQINLLVCHIGKDNPELAAMKDLNEFGLGEMSKHRDAELEALKSFEFREFLEKQRIDLKVYREIVEDIGLGNMKSPLKRDETYHKK
ncbi:ChbG/HpnK family deacetylase [Bacteroidota bacterium]